MDVIIIGGGIVGATTALNLIESGTAKVTVVDSWTGDGVSAPSFAWINAWSTQPIAYHNLRVKACEEWKQFVSSVGGADSVGYRSSCLKWADDEASAAHLREAVRTLQGLGHDIQEISAEELRGLEPGIHPHKVTYAAYARDEWVVDGGRLAQRCLELAKEKGLTVRNCRVESIVAATPNSRCKVVSDQGTLECDTVVLAAGIGSAKLAASIGVDIPMVRSPGVLARTPASAGPQPLLRSSGMVQWYSSLPDKGVVSYHMKTNGDERLERLVFGEGDGLHRNDDADDQFVTRTLSLWRSCCPELENVGLERDPLWYRPLPLDGRPVVGAAANGVYISVMHSGITLAPLIARLAATEILSGKPQPDLNDYRLERFATTQQGRL